MLWPITSLNCGIEQERRVASIDGRKASVSSRSGMLTLDPSVTAAWEGQVPMVNAAFLADFIAYLTSGNSTG